MEIVRGGISGRAERVLVTLCIAVAVAAVTWQSWDMFGSAKRPMLQGVDDSFYYVWLPGVVIHHSLDFSKSLESSHTMTDEALAKWKAQARTPTGLLPSKYPPGWAISSLPFFLIAHAFSPAGSTGFEPGYLMAVWVGQILYAAAGLALAARIIARLLPGTPALVAVLAVWLSSPLAYYQTARVSFSHSIVFVLAMAIFWLSLGVVDGDRRKRTWFLLGFFCALMVVTRNLTVVYLVLPAVVIARHCRGWKAFCLLALGAAGPAAAQVAAWKVFFGSWVAYSYGAEQFDFSQFHVREVLFSSFHGWFYWHPLLLVGSLAFVWWASERPVAWPWMISLFAIIGLNAAWPHWWFGSSFGNRGFEVATFFAMVGVASLLALAKRQPSLRPVMAAMLSLAITWNLALLALSMTHHIPTDQPVTYAEAGRALVSWIF